jgi:glycosyltransferase involved in cell wall biosynthesis
MSREPDVSVVLPCLNEEEALPHVLTKIKRVFEAGNINGEIVVCDNRSEDASAEIARSHGARVVSEPVRGYGRAYLTGFAAARGRFLVMGDADDTYDFNLISKFLEPLKEGRADFVSGSRYLTGGEGEIPWLHRWIGNPALTWVLNRLFGSKYTDVYCGFRAFSRSAYDRIRPVSTGMEFNLELAINASLARLKIVEIPIRLAPRKGVSKLRTFSDGWRSLRMMLLYSPNVVFFIPGFGLFASGVLIELVTLFREASYEGRRFGAVTSFCGMVAAILGFKILSLGLHAKSYSWSRRFESHNPLLERFYKNFTLENGLLVGLGLMGAGLAVLATEAWIWIRTDLHPLPRPEWVPVGATFLVMGVETFFTSLFISAMSIERAAPAK